MKILHTIILSMLAIITATAGVLTAHVFGLDTNYYKSTLRGAHCDVTINSNPCDEGGQTQCAFISQGTTYYVSQKIEDGPCIGIFREY